MRTLYISIVGSPALAAIHRIRRLRIHRLTLGSLFDGSGDSARRAACRHHAFMGIGN